MTPHPEPHVRSPGHPVVEGAHAEADGHRAGEHGRRRVPARAVRADDQERADDEGDRKRDLVQHAAQKGPGQGRRERGRNRHSTTIDASTAAVIDGRGEQASAGRAPRARPLPRSRGAVLHDGALRSRRRGGEGRAAGGRRRDAHLGAAVRRGRVGVLPLGQPGEAERRARSSGRAVARRVHAAARATRTSSSRTFAPAAPMRSGVGFEQVRAVNPRVVYCSITGFGDREPAGRPGYDFVIQAESGLMSITGEPTARRRRSASRSSTCSPA